MDERALRDALRDAAIPGGAPARARARRTVLAAHADLSGDARHQPRRWTLAIGPMLVLAVAAITVGAGPAATAHWVGRTLRIEDRVPPHRSASLVDLPGGGRLLVSTGSAAWVIGQGPPHRIAGITDQVGWSAFGHYLLRTHGTRVQALDTSGRVVWTQHYARQVQFPSWSPDGNRVAFRVGRAIEVTAGDGTGAHALVARGARAPLRSLAVAPAWRPGTPRHELALLDSRRRITLIDADSGELLWRLLAPRATLSLSWSHDGRRLLAVGARSRRLYGPSGQLLAVRAAASRTRIVAGVLSPSGAQVALLRTRAGAATAGARRDVVLVAAVRSAAAPRLLIAGHDLGDLRFSPTGRWLLVGWHRVDSWLFFATAPGDRRMRIVSSVSRRVGRGEPIVEGWCCAQRQR